MTMLLAVTQRVEMVDATNERRDCLDQQWAPFLNDLGLWAVPVPNGLTQPSSWFRELGLQGILLTGGNDLGILPAACNPSPERDAVEETLLGLAAAQGLPVLGVCRGFQMLNVHCGGSLSPVTGHAGTHHEVMPRDGHPGRFFRDFKPTEVNSYHNYGILEAELAKELVPILGDGAGRVEAAEHRILPWAGIMWHPERGFHPHPSVQMLFRKVFSP